MYPITGYQPTEPFYSGPRIRAGFLRRLLDDGRFEHRVGTAFLRASTCG